ncbi:hypothetical protein Tco_1106435 [Tanacetum coccineum]
MKAQQSCGRRRLLSDRCTKEHIKVKGFMWCMQKAMARESSLERLEKTKLDVGPAGLVFGPAELAQKTPN